MARVRKAVVTAAGAGLQHYPATQCFQKELIPLIDRDGMTRTAIQIILQEALDAGIEEFCLVVSPDRVDQFKDYFRGLDEDQLRYLRGKQWALDEAERLESLGRRITYVIQEHPEGDGHAVHSAREWVGSDPFLLLLGDHIFIPEDKSCSRQVIEVFEEREAPVSGVHRTDADYLHQFGTVTGRRVSVEPSVYELTLIHEKPTIEFAEENLRTRGLRRDEYLCFFGVHVMPPALMDALGHLIRSGRKSRSGYQLSDGLELLRREDTFLAVEVEGARFDMGTPLGLIETQFALALNSSSRRQVMSWLPNMLSFYDMEALK